jgi:methionyl-tRNA synthetase
MYVWFDALVNYISALGWPDDQENFKKFWVEGAPVQIAGKDNLRQQTAMWQAMLMSAGLPLSRQILIHGNITLNGQKMSKSLGNTIDPIAVADKYGVDALRYILLRHANPFEDSDMSDASIAEWYTANLVNGLGNLVARIMKLAEANLPSPVSLTVEDTTVESAFSEKIEAFEFQQATDLVFEHIQKGDEYMTSNEPFKKIKSENSSVREQGLADIEKLVRHIAKVAMHLALMMPDTSAKILAAVSANKKPENLFPRL